MEQPVIAPIIHLNGDRPEMLSCALRDAYRAIGTAVLALKHTAPNARNYYPQPGLFEQARAQYRGRAEALRSVQASLLSEYRAIGALAEKHQGRMDQLDAEEEHGFLPGNPQDYGDST